MINENEDKVKYYQSWYGEKCPYTFKINNNNNHNNQNNNNKQIKTKLNNNNNHNNNNNSYINEEREYTSSITKRITPQQQQSQKQQLNKHHEIILGPKKIRPNSAIQPSGLIPLSKSSISKRPNSGLKKIQKYDMTDELNEENAVLMIRAALCNIDKQTINDNDQNKIQLPIQSNTNTNTNTNSNSNSNSDTNSNTNSDNQNINNNNNINSNQKKNNQNKTTPTNIKPSEIQSVKDVDIITQRRIVPSVEKNYLRVRPSSPIPIDKNPVVNIVQDNKQEFQLTPHPELVKRSLFVAGLRNSIKKSEEIINNSSNDEKNIGLVIENSKNTTKEKEKEIVPRLSKVRPQSANITSARRKTDLTVTEPQISPHSPHSPHRLSTRSSLSKNSTPKSTPRTTQIQTDSNNNNNDTNNDNNSPKTRLMSAVGKSIQRPSQMVLEKKTPRGDGTDIEPVGEESTVEDDLSTARDEATSFPLFSIVEARYKGRSHWWTGKIVQARLDGTYDIQFGDILERHVPSSRIRVKPSVDIDKIKSKIRITGMLATTLRDTYENIQKDDTDIVTMEDEFNPVPLENIVRDSGSSPAPRSLVRKTIVRVLSGSLASGEDSNSSQQSQSQSQQKQPFPSRSSLFSQITAGATKLRKVEHQMEAAAEAVAEAKRRFEIKEQQRLWPELKKTVTKFRNEIAFEDVKVLRELGRGKFASVHIAELNVRLHTKVFSSREGVKRTLERLGNNLNKIQYGVKHLTLPCALKVLEYSDAYPLTGGDWEHDKPPEKNYNDNQVYTDENEITGGDNNIDNDEKRERSNSMADTSIDPINEYRSYQEKYKVMPPSKSILESLREIKALTLLQHKNIIMLHGVILAPRLILVLEKMQYSLADLISTHPDKLPVQLISSQKLTILHDISNGLNHIHSHNHIHRDIKIHNILVSCGGGGYVAKIADFGTALHITKARKLTEAVGTSGYTAPEVTDPGSYDISIDIFSFGILMWETIQPYENKIDNPLCGLTSEEATEKIKQGVRPPLKHCELTQIHPLIERCWATVPTKRPTSDLLYQELTNYFSCI